MCLRLVWLVQRTYTHLGFRVFLHCRTSTNAANSKKHLCVDWQELISGYSSSKAWHESFLQSIICALARHLCLPVVRYLCHYIRVIIKLCKLRFHKTNIAFFARPGPGRNEQVMPMGGLRNGTLPMKVRSNTAWWIVHRVLCNRL